MKFKLNTQFLSLYKSRSTVTVRRSQLKTDQLLAMDTSVKLNGLVREHSSDAALVMMNMPPPVTPYVDSITGNVIKCIFLYQENSNCSAPISAACWIYE